MPYFNQYIRDFTFKALESSSQKIFFCPKNGSIFLPQGRESDRNGQGLDQIKAQGCAEQLPAGWAHRWEWNFPVHSETLPNSPGRGPGIALARTEQQRIATSTTLQQLVQSQPTTILFSCPPFQPVTAHGHKHSHFHRYTLASKPEFGQDRDA